LKIECDFPGKKTFSRGWRFNKHELAALESLLVELLIPLQRALEHLTRIGHCSREPAGHNSHGFRISAVPIPARCGLISMQRTMALIGW
jgi:hypothetical protein